MVKPRVLILGEPRHSGGALQLNHELFDIDIIQAQTRPELIQKLCSLERRYQAVICRLSSLPFQPFNAELLSPLLPDLRIVVSAASGYDDFELEWVSAQNITFVPTYHAMSEATAEMALFLLLAVLRNTSNAERSMRAGTWRDSLELAPDTRAMTLGIIGVGKIGCDFARKACCVLGFKRIVCYSTSGRRRTTDGLDLPPQATLVASLDELLRLSDVVSIHCALNESTRGTISSREFALMKQGSYLINTARGAVVDENALIKAIEDGRIKRAGLDVFVGEPYGINSYFQTSEKVVVQPHVGGLTQSAFARAEGECFANLRNFFREETSRNLVREVRAGDMELSGERSVL